ncbi:transcriptional regulator [Crocinitomix sp.]|nr:transcriptional regulator [Crocinitomix sp.]
MSSIDGLNKAFDSRVRLGIMSMLMVNEWMDYKTVKEQLDLTDGNLASHIAGLEKLDYIDVRKRFVGKKTNTSYKITALGKIEFQSHINALEKIINKL